MSDYGDLVGQHLSSVASQTISGLDENPDDAARAVQLSQSTGIAAPVIAGDLDGFDQQYKSRLASNLVVNNPQLRAYVSAHPMAAAVSNDDWANLDQFSQGATATQNIFRALHAPMSWLDKPIDQAIQGGIEGFKEGFGQQSPEVQRLTNPQTTGYIGALAAASTWGAAELALRGMSGIFGATTGAVKGGATAIGGEQFGRDVAGEVERRMMTGEIPPEAHWVENGKEPPRGISPQIDANKAQINAQALTKLEEDLTNAQASTTKERSPEMFRRFVDQHYGDSTIGISGDAVAALYGDKIPTTDDGLLGFVPGIQDQLQVAKETGADVHVPVSDWISNVDPALATQLHDDIRVWPGGITAREASEPIEPKATVDSPLAQERGAFGLEPMFSMGDRKLQLLKQEGKPSAGPEDMADRLDEYKILDENGQPVGNLRIGRGDDKELLVDWIGGQAGLWANSFGPSLIRDLKRQLKALYPDYDYLTGYRISGARDAAAAPDELRIPRVRLDAEPFEDFHATRQILDNAWQEVGSGIYGAYEPTSALTANELAMTKAVHDEIRRISGEGPEIHGVSGLVSEGTLGTVRGAYIPFDNRAPIIAYDMLGPDPLGTGRHESIHYLRRYGIFTPEEWDTLEQTARDENWIGRYGISDRYGNLAENEQLEESVAEAFREWAGANRPKGGNIGGIFQKLWDFLSRIKDRFKGIFGHEPTWEELFQKTARGDIGQRGPGEPLHEGTFNLRPSLSLDDRDTLRANALGLDRKTYDNLRALTEKQHEEDIEAATNRAQREQTRRQTKEWKENRAEMSKDVESTIRQRPDVAADLFIGNGELYGKKLQQRYTLREDDLTPEQKEALPDHYVSKNGLPVDEVARLFGYGSGDAMVEKLAAYNAFKGDLSPREALKKLVDTETDRQMEAKYGNLGENILDEARDQALSETNLDRMAEEMVAAGMKSGQAVVDKDVVKSWAQEYIGKQAIGTISSDKYMTVVGKHGRDAERSLINGDPASATISLQKKYASAILAAQARKIEKAKTSFDKIAKRMSNRQVPSIDPEYMNHIHDILTRIDKPVKRSVQDINKEIKASASGELEKFVEDKAAALRELPVWDQLYDSTWRKPYEELTADEFNAVSNTIKSLVHNGRDELKIEKAGEAADLSVIKDKMIRQLEQFPQIDFTKPGGRRGGVGFLRTKIAAHLQLENLFNRWDEYDPQGVWNQWGIRGLIEGANQEDVWKKEFAQKLRDTDDEIDLKKSVNNTIFRQPTRLGTGQLIQFNRGNLRAVMLNAGNVSNLTKLAKGYGLTGDVVKAWINQHATKEDWDWVQKVWGIFNELKSKSDTMYRSLTGGVPAEDIKVQPIETKFGTYKGGYYPVIWHPEFEGSSKKLMGKNSLEESNYVRATTPAGYTKSRTGYSAPMALDIDQLPNRMAQEIHDIAMRPAVIQASKIFYDKDIRQAITNHYGSEYTDLLTPYLRDVANVQNFMSKAQAEFNSWSGFFRQNLITTLVGLNPGTVMKHAPTALGLSIKEVGPSRFLDAVKSLFSINDETGDSNYNFAMNASQELQRRDRNWQETLYGASGELRPGQKLASWRQRIMELSSKPVALSDKISAVPTWLAAYRQAMEDGSTHGDAVYFADRAVRRAHGSTAITNRPGVMRDSNPWFTSVYNFFNDVMNRQMETLWKAGDTMDLIKEGDHKAAMAMGGMVAAGLAAYVIWPAMVEQYVSPINEDPNASWVTKSAEGLIQTLSSSWIIVRDVVNAMLSGRDPSVGLFSTAFKEISDVTRDFGKHQPMNKEHAGKVIKDGLSLAGFLTGTVPGQVGREAQFAHDIQTGAVHPRGPWQWLVGLRYGTLKKHSSTWDNYLQGKAK